MLAKEMNISWKKLLPKRKQERKKVNRETVETYRKELEENPTLCEQIIIEELSKKNVEFKFQHPIIFKYNFFIADFFFPKDKLILEIDGGYHKPRLQKIKDECRTIKLETRGYAVIRVTNADIMNQRNGVVEKVLSFLS